MIPELNQEIVSFIKDHMSDKAEAVAMKVQKLPQLPITWISKQIKYRQKGILKLKTWADNFELIFPTELAYEQCSSESTALYKASLVSGKSLIDITGGSGVDTWALASKFESTVYCEQQEVLGDIAQHNFSILNPSIEVKNTDGIEFIKQLTHSVDCIFLDPHRRNEQKDRVFQLADCEPDITTELDALFEKTDTILLKAAPMADIQRCISELHSVKEVHIVSVKNECKELLFLLEKGFIGAKTYVAINLETDQQPLRWQSEELATSQMSEPLSYLYEPNSSVLKGGAFKTCGEQFNLFKLHRHSHLYTSDILNTSFPGRAFKIVTTGSPKEIAKLIPNKKANIAVRNYSMKAPDLAKKLKVKDGGDYYVFGTTLKDDKPKLILCQKV